MTSDRAGHDHPHAVSAATDVRILLVALSIIVTFLVAELVAAIIGGSLALLADAGHMLTDAAALGVSAWAIRLAARPAQGRWTYGLKRAEILSAAANGVTLVAIAIVIFVEAVQRLIAPQPVAGGLVLVVALVGAVVNVAAGWVLAKANQASLNVRAAYAHILTDLYAFVGTAIAGLVIVVSGWRRADSVASLFVVVLMARTAWGLLRDAGRILLQGAPDDLDLGDVRAHLIEVAHVLDVHDLHAWTLTSGHLTLSAHVVVEAEGFDGGRAPQILDALQDCLVSHFAIDHATFQLEPPAHVEHEGELHP